MSGCCPVHGGDRHNALVFFPDGDTAPGVWKCYSHQCEHSFGKTVLGLIRGVLSHQKLGWTKPGMDTVDFTEAVDWACDFLGIRLDTISSAELATIKEAREKRPVAPKIDRSLCNRQQWRQMLKIPAPYFMYSRKPSWSANILDKYDVGYCNGDHLEGMRCRSVIPIYDAEYYHVIGYTGRSIFEKCPQCGGYHYHKSKCPKHPGSYSKWKNSSGFNRDQHLFNLWFAKPHILQRRKAVLVEGPGEVLRVEEAGIQISLATLGVGLTDAQQILLEMLGVNEVIICMNSDEAGQESRDVIAKQLMPTCRVHAPKIPAGDFGEMYPLDVYDFLNPLVES